MRKTLFVALFSAVFAATSAQSLLDRRTLIGTEGPMLNIKLDTRFDYRHTDQTGVSEYSNFETKVLRVLVTGEIAPGVRYALRQLLNKPSTALGDGSGSGTNYFWVAFDAGQKKQWTITVGKQTTLLGTYEFSYNAADVYMPTLVNSDFDFYHLGVNAAYRFAGQTLSLQVINAGNQFAAHADRNRALAGAFTWAGSLFNDVIGTKIGYAAFQHHGSEFYHWITAGIQINTGRLTTELDLYHGDRYLDYNATVSTREGQHHVRDLSAAANFKVNLGKWRPSIKGIWDRRKDMELCSNAYGNLGVQAALEFYPFDEALLKDLRLFAVYSYKHTDFDGPFSNMDSKRVHTALVGMRWLMPIK